MTEKKEETKKVARKANSSLEDKNQSRSFRQHNMYKHKKRLGSRYSPMAQVRPEKPVVQEHTKNGERAA